MGGEGLWPRRVRALRWPLFFALRAQSGEVAGAESTLDISSVSSYNVSRRPRIMVRMSHVRALVVASHPGPTLAITGFATLLAVQAAPHGVGPLLTFSAMLAGQL